MQFSYCYTASCPTDSYKHTNPSDCYLNADANFYTDKHRKANQLADCDQHCICQQSVFG